MALLFSSAAKFETLGLLSQRSSPLPLRHIAYLTGLPIRSVEMAVAALCKQKALRRQKVGRRFLISINEEHDKTALVREIFGLVNKRISPQPNLDTKAQQVLAFVDSTNDLFRKVKR